MNIEYPKYTPALADDLCAAGIESGDFLLVQSSFKALGIPGITPSEVISTMMEVLGPEGTLMMPTYTYSFSGIFGVKPFNKDTTPGFLNGILTETLRLFPGALRSGHPTYSVAALGKYAERITAGMELSSAMGRGSSSDEAYKLGAKILLLGVRNSRNSMLHYAEIVAGLPYNHIPFREFMGSTALVERDGKIAEVPLVEEYPACSANFFVADDFLLEREIAREVSIGKAVSLLMSARDTVDAVVKRLQDDPAWLLCGNIICEPCNRRKHHLRKLGLI